MKLRLITLIESENVAKTPEAKQYAQDLLSGKANPYEDELKNGAPATYDAIFNGDQPPYFLMIQNSQPGHGFGYLAFMHFLNYVGVGEEFGSTDFTPAGKSLFDKATQQKVIASLPNEVSGLNLTKSTWWKVVSNPMQIIQQVANSAT
tara:strand:+ start:4043 stop:4486 length:444 start_codon:yes stop_codon:yes gene_type:complete